MDTMETRCSQCGKVFRVRLPGDAQGKRIMLSYRCPACGAQLSQEVRGTGDGSGGGFKRSFDHGWEEEKGRGLSLFQRGPLEILGLLPALLTVLIFSLALAGLFIDISPVFAGLDRALDKALSPGVFVINSTNIGLLSRIFVILCCLPIHEAAHALTAYILGDDTGRREGRISLNPVRHLDIMGLVLVLFVGIGYAKPVPVNINRFKHKKLGFALTSVAGPISNLLMAVMILLLLRGVSFASLSQGPLLYQFLIQASYINVSLAVFNLLPIPPLDGSRVAFALLPDKLYQGMLKNERMVMGVLMVSLYALSYLGYNPISLIASRVFSLVYGLCMG